MFLGIEFLQGALLIVFFGGLIYAFYKGSSSGIGDMDIDPD